MSQAATLIGLYSILIVASSLFGGWLPSLLRLTHVRTQLMLSFVGGLMLGVGLLHMLPHSFEETGSLDTTLIWTLVGLLGMFFLIRIFHFHQHGPSASAQEHDGSVTEEEGGHVHSHGAGCRHEDPSPTLHSMSWVGVAIGLAVHTFIDGVALGAAVIADTTHRPSSWPAAMGVFLAILLHKPLDALSITSLMQAGGWSRRVQQVVNAGFALMCPLGAWSFLAGTGRVAEHSHELVGTALAISAGVFLCISLGDLLPEVQFHQHDRLKLSAALLLGVATAYAMGYLEPEHAHSAGHSHGSEADHHHEVAPPAAHDPGPVAHPADLGDDLP